MLNLAQIKKQVANDLPDKELYQACLNVCEYIEKSKPSLLQHIDYQTLLKASKTQNTNLLLQSIQYLTGARVQLLVSAYELFYDDFPIQIEKSYLAEAEKEGVFAHPETGEVIDDYRSFIEIYFKLSDHIEVA